MSYLEKLSRQTGHERHEGYTDTVHKIRVTVKKLRAVWRLYRESVGDAPYRRHNERLRRLSRMFAAHREHDILCQLVRKYEVPDKPGELIPPTRDQLAQAFAVLHFEIAQLRSLSIKRKHIKRGLKRSIKRFRRAQDHCERRKATPEEFHEWRKETKNLMYQYDFAKAAGLKVPAKRMARLSKLAKHLGDAHDLDMLAVFLKSRHADKSLVHVAAKNRDREEHKSLRHSQQLH